MAFVEQYDWRRPASKMPRSGVTVAFGIFRFVIKCRINAGQMKDKGKGGDLDPSTVGASLSNKGKVLLLCCDVIDQRPAMKVRKKIISRLDLPRATLDCFLSNLSKSLKSARIRDRRYYSDERNNIKMNK